MSLMALAVMKAVLDHGIKKVLEFELGLTVDNAFAEEATLDETIFARNDAQN